MTILYTITDKNGVKRDMTAEEKTAANYVERTTYKIDKGENKQGDKLMRKKLNPSYD